MNDDGRQQAFMSALVTEHFVLQSAPGATISEASGRAAWSPRSMARWARRRRMGDGGGPRRVGAPASRVHTDHTDQDLHGLPGRPGQARGFYIEKLHGNRDRRRHGYPQHPSHEQPGLI
jgi:hypothetical protein